MMFNKILLLNCPLGAQHSFCFPMITIVQCSTLEYPVSGGFTTAATFQLPQMAPLNKWLQMAKPDCSATIKSTVKAARPARTHLEDKLRLTHQTLRTLHLISSWIQRDSARACVHAAFSPTQIPPLHHRHHSNASWAQATTSKDSEVPQVDLVGSLQSLLNEEVSCSSIFGAFHKKITVPSILFEKVL